MHILLHLENVYNRMSFSSILSCLNNNNKKYDKILLLWPVMPVPPNTAIFFTIFALVPQSKQPLMIIMNAIENKIFSTNFESILNLIIILHHHKRTL